MQRALQEYLGFSDVWVDKFLAHLDKNNMVIAGSFPLLWACNPTPDQWHARTRQEVTALLLVAKRLGWVLPRGVCEEIGNNLQLADFIEDYHEGNIDVDIFLATLNGHARGQRELFQFFNQWRRQRVTTQGSYALMRDVQGVWELIRGKKKINVIQVTELVDPYSSVEVFIENFDFSFCRATHKTSSMLMVGMANLEKWKWSCKYIGERLKWGLQGINDGTPLPGLQPEDFAGLASILADTIRNRLDKYERRRFTILNKAAAEELAREADALAARIL